MPRPAGLLMALCVVLLDQLSKYYITGPLGLPTRDAIDIVPIFRLIWVENHGISLGLFRAGSEVSRWLLTLATAAIAVGVAVWLLREKGRIEALALGSILGGAIGNIADRVRLGYVADFLNLHFGAWSPFLVFNVADAGISLGVTMLVLRALFAPRSHALAEK